MRTAPRFRFVVAVSAVAMLAPTLALSQQTTANTRFYVQVVRLKPDMVTEWTALQRDEVIPAQKKAGITSRTTLVTQVGNSFEYAIITPFPTWAAMDTAPPLVRALGTEGAAQLNAKLRKSILTQQTYMSNRVDSLTILAPNALVWRTVVQRLLPGKTAEYVAYYRTDVLPALRKAKANGTIAGATLAIRGAGATTGEFTTTTLYDKFADLETGDPLARVLSPAEAQAIRAKSAQFATGTQVIIRRRLADLSF